MGRELFAGPWLGEFGPEVMRWQAYVRAASRSYDRTIVCSFPDRAVLYCDFADEFVGHGIRCVSVGWRASPETRPSEREIETLIPSSATDRFVPRPSFGSLEPEFIRYGRPRADKAGWLLFHARAHRESGGDRNWPTERWHGLGRRLARRRGVPPMASVGSRNASILVDGTKDLRGVPLSELMDWLASARLVVGPLSGVMHLASLCGAPHLVWVGEDSLVVRYERAWNPLGTPCHVVPGRWRPGVDAIQVAILGCLSGGCSSGGRGARACASFAGEREPDFPRRVICPQDAVSLRRYEEYRGYYKGKWRTAARLQPRRILEIGVRAGYSAWAFLNACPHATYLGIDDESGRDGGQGRSWLFWARRLLAPYDAQFLRIDSQTLYHLPGEWDLIHIDGDHSEAGVYHDMCTAWASLSDSGSLLIDDYDHLPRVRRGIQRWLREHPRVVTEHIPSLRGELLVTKCCARPAS